MATLTSDSYHGRYMQLDVSEGVDVVNNKSTLYWSLKVVGGSTQYYTTGPTNVYINGTNVYSRGRVNWNEKVFPAACGSVSGSIDVWHEWDGSKSVEIELTTAIYKSQTDTHRTTMYLTNIDRTAPTVSFSVSNIKSDSFTINAMSSTYANAWWYSLNGGSGWYGMSTNNSTAESITVTGLSPNTTYDVQVSARKTSNQVDGYSGRINVKTLGATNVSNASQVNADEETVKVSFDVTTYDSNFYHRIYFNNGHDFLTIDLGQFPAGFSNRTVYLSEAEKEILLRHVTEKTLNGRLYVGTFTSSNYQTLVGNYTYCPIVIATSSELSAPIFNNFTYKDIRDEISNVVGTNQVLVQNYSQLEITCEPATAKNYSEIASYSVSIGDSTVTSKETLLNVGSISTQGEAVDITVTCTDSRGYTAAIKRQIKILPYTKPKITNCKLRRKDEVEPLVQLTFRGSFSALMADGETNTNSLKTVGFYYKETSAEEYSAFVSLLDKVSVNSTSFEFSSLELISLDENKSYNFHIVVRDQFDTLSSCDLYLVLAQGTPLISLRKISKKYNFARLGINNPTPTEALDVNGNIKANGIITNMFVKLLTGDENLNSITQGGYYIQEWNSNVQDYKNYPSKEAGILEVLASPTNCIIQRYTVFYGATVYIRAYWKHDNRWTNWNTFSN